MTAPSTTAGAAFTSILATPIGELRLAVDAVGAVLAIDLPGHCRALPGAVRDDRRCAALARQLREYFAGERRAFELALAARGTPFQQRAWGALLSIPFGRTASYQEQAQRIGSPRAMRAVGAANGRNPIPIVVPCHRVIGKDGSLTGFGGGLRAKQWLLRHEAAVLARNARAPH